MFLLVGRGSKSSSHKVYKAGEEKKMFMENIQVLYVTLLKLYTSSSVCNLPSWGAVFWLGQGVVLMMTHQVLW